MRDRSGPRERSQHNPIESRQPDVLRPKHIPGDNAERRRVPGVDVPDIPQLERVRHDLPPRKQRSAIFGHFRFYILAIFRASHLGT